MNKAEIDRIKHWAIKANLRFEDFEAITSLCDLALRMGEAIEGVVECNRLREIIGVTTTGTKAMFALSALVKEFRGDNG